MEVVTSLVSHVEPVPEGSALFHIGSPKTATSAVQYSAAAKRSVLAERGLVYPASRKRAKSPHRHRDGVRSLRAFGEGRSPHPVAWDALIAQRDSHPGARMLISDEWAATLPKKSIEYARDSLGEGAQVVFSTRNYSEFLLSLWQEDLRNGKITVGLQEWLEGLDFGRKFGPMRGRIPIERQADRLRRWVDAFGADHVNVLIVNKATPGLVYEAFAALLGLVPADLEPASDADRGPAGNRGLTAVEARFVEQLIAEAGEADVTEEQRLELLSRGAFKRLQHFRTPPPDEPKLGIPESRIGAVEDFARRQWAVVEKLGVRVIGDPAEFVRPPKANPEVDSDTVPLDLAVQAVLGVVKAAPTATAIDKSAEA